MALPFVEGQSHLRILNQDGLEERSD